MWKGFSEINPFSDESQRNKENKKAREICHEEATMLFNGRIHVFEGYNGPAPFNGEQMDACKGEFKSLDEMLAVIDAGYDTVLSIIRDNRTVKGKIGDTDLDKKDAVLVMEIGRAMHDKWCQVRASDYPQQLYEGTGFKYLSTEAIGWKEFEKLLPLVDIVMESKHLLGDPARLGFITGDIENQYITEKAMYEMGTSGSDRIWLETNRWMEIPGLPVGEDSLHTTDFVKEAISQIPEHELGGNAVGL